MREKGIERLSRRRRDDFRWFDCLHSVFVVGLNQSTDVGDLLNIFSLYGKVIDVDLLKREGQARGSAFLRFRLVEEFQRVIRRSDELRIDGNWMHVVVAVSRDSN